MTDAPIALGAMLDLAAERHPEAAAVVFKGRRITYRDLRERAEAFARGLLALGLGPGDHVVLWMPNSIEWNVVNFAIAKIGAVTVTCNRRYKAFEVEYLFVMAFVIPRSGETLTPGEVVDFGRGQIANFKVPKHVEVVSEFPLTGSGKVQKFKQRVWAIDTYRFAEPK